MKQRVPHIQALEAVGEVTSLRWSLRSRPSDEAKSISGATIDFEGGYSLGVWR